MNICYSEYKPYRFIKSIDGGLIRVESKLTSIAKLQLTHGGDFMTREIFSRIESYMRTDPVTNKINYERVNYMLCEPELLVEGEYLVPLTIYLI
jgi:hypothetical protein